MQGRWGHQVVPTTKSFLAQCTADVLRKAYVNFDADCTGFVELDEFIMCLVAISDVSMNESALRYAAFLRVKQRVLPKRMSLAQIQDCISCGLSSKSLYETKSSSDSINDAESEFRLKSRLGPVGSMRVVNTARPRRTKVDALRKHFIPRCLRTGRIEQKELDEIFAASTADSRRTDKRSSLGFSAEDRESEIRALTGRIEYGVLRDRRRLHDVQF